MTDNRNNKQDAQPPKKGFPTSFFLLLLAVILVIITVQNFMTTKRAKVGFSHQVEHLVNLNLLVPEESRKVSLNDNLVSFSGHFRERETEEGQRRFRFLELLEQKHQLESKKADALDVLGQTEGKVNEAATWFLGVSGTPIPAGGYQVVDGTSNLPDRNNAVVIQSLSNKEMTSLTDLQAQLPTVGNSPSAIDRFGSQLAVLIDDFRSPVLGIGSESIKQELKTMSRQVEEAQTTSPTARLALYNQVLTRLSQIVKTLNEPVGHFRLTELRSVRQYREEIEGYATLSHQIEQNSAQLDKARAAVSSVIWFFNNKELSTRALERQDPELYSHWFANAKEDWDNFKYNRGLPFKAPDQPRNLVLEKKFKSEEPAPNYFSYILTLLPIALVIMLLYFVFSRQMKGGVGGGALSFGKSPARLLNKTDNKVTFKDVAGIEEAKEELVEIVEFLKNPLKYTSLGGRIPKGVLLIGSPGTGKTLVAKAVAGEADRPFFSIAGSDFVEMFVGVGASRIRDMFEQAKKNAPCIIFIDEIDAVGRHRGAGVGGGHDEREQTLNQLLVEMDGFDTNEGVILMAATNRPDVLDKALLRPGRFDRRVAISLPDIKGRYEILKVHVRKIKMDPKVDLMDIARSTPGASGAELENLLNEAALQAARVGRTAVTGPDVREARDKVLFGKERRSLELDENEKKTTAYHESGHTIIGLKVEHSDPIDKVTIIPRGFSLGATHFLPEKNRLSYWKKEILDQLIVLMGGRAAEEIFVGDISSGAQQDFSQATSLARSMVCRWGMSELGFVAYDEGGSSDEYALPPREKSYSEETAQAIDKEVKRLLDHAYSRALEIIKENRPEMELMTQMLMEFETLDAYDIKAIIDNTWDPEEKRKKVQDHESNFKREIETPPPPPEQPRIDLNKTEGLGLDPT
ncbi:MAG: ATP-dependent zinc metalloprotease FtsH [Chlamydiales bacterium]|nr:ATP-dependent zinc metalloprotease FtsH [Chlamydiales bacterium]MCH9620410.1 ATP-dependent zinc metalloprotease FtsH [Chlamydiales bacterium]MCH9622944.1 ATP-dependent zinc metalloprotease FtsH [Chlamydiales bacterium]